MNTQAIANKFLEDAKDTVNRLICKVDLLETHRSLCKRYAKLGMLEEARQQLNHLKKREEEFYSTLTSLEESLMKILPPKSIKKRILAEQQTEELFYQATQFKWKDAEIRVFASMTPQQVVAMYSPALAQEFEKFATRSGLYWKDTRTGESFDLGDAIKNELLRHNKARYIFGLK